jgi:hypothetical protein
MDQITQKREGGGRERDKPVREEGERDRQRVFCLSFLFLF